MSKLIFNEFESPARFILVSCLAYSSALKIEVICSSEISIDFDGTTQSYIPKDRILHTHRCENFKLYVKIILDIAAGGRSSVVSRAIEEQPLPIQRF
jgi:hypothetical protein